jgi:hypothetical protein
MTSYHSQFCRLFQVGAVVLLSFGGQIFVLGQDDDCADVVGATVTQNENDGTWTISATISSPYEAETGWDKYADEFKVVHDGATIGTRTLAHPHANEQPFTRSLSGIDIPEDASFVIVSAQDSVSGYCGTDFQLWIRTSAAPSPDPTIAMTMENNSNTGGNSSMGMFDVLNETTPIDKNTATNSSGSIESRNLQQMFSPRSFIIDSTMEDEEDDNLLSQTISGGRNTRTICFNSLFSLSILLIAITL